MEPASTNIDAAADFAADGKYKEAQACYRAAIAALDKIEANNPERAATPEFATVRNKRAYVNAALDSMLLAEARDNAKAVAVTDTTDLEVKLVTKPWKEFLPTYAALTNADRLVTKRLKYVESSEARALLNAVRDPRLQSVSVSNCNELGKAKALYAAQWEEFGAACKSTAAAVFRLEKFAETVSSPDGTRIFDVCKKDARAGISACKDAWPKVGESLAAMDRRLENLHGVLLEAGAQRDFAVVARRYAEKAGEADLKRVEGLAVSNGYWKVHCQMLAELQDPKWVIAFTGAVRRVELKWGGSDPDVPQKEDDRGLVKDDGDSRPKIESQVEAHVEKERKRAEKVKKAVARAKTTKKVQKEVKDLLEKDPKSRRARMLKAGEDLRNGDAAAAKEKVKALLDEKPNDGPALNMRAAIEAAAGDLKAAEKTLDQAIQSNPRDYHAYYNMANVYLQKGNVDGARRYYETGRSYAGPKDEVIEKAIKK